MIDDPRAAGAVNDSVALASPLVATTSPGVAGTSKGTTSAPGADQSECPRAFWARTSIW